MECRERGAAPEKLPKISRITHGNLGLIGISAVIMQELGNLLWVNGKKFRVTIEYDPDTGSFEAKREEFL